MVPAIAMFHIAICMFSKSVASVGGVAVATFFIEFHSDVKPAASVGAVGIISGSKVARSEPIVLSMASTWLLASVQLSWFGMLSASMTKINRIKNRINFPFF